VAQKFRPTFFTLLAILQKNHFGRFFHKLVWPPCSQWTSFVLMPVESTPENGSFPTGENLFIVHLFCDDVRRLGSRVARLFLVKNTQTGENIPNYHELYKMSIKYNNRPKNGQVSIKYRYQHLPLQVPPKFTQIGIFGLKICMPSGNPVGQLNKSVDGWAR
jgi:hypothetical protein